MDLVLETLAGARVDERPLEIVERKGLGHPDTICDALSERLSVALSRFYLERFGGVCHHNVDKALLRGGASRPRFGGGEVVEPIEIHLAGRATAEWKGVEVPVVELAVEESRAWIAEHLRFVDPVEHVRVHSLVRPGSADLVELFGRRQASGVWLSNDTSCGVGYAPLSRLERVVDGVERRLNAPETKRAHPALGEDVKVMGVRHGDDLELTVSCAMVDAHCRDAADYAAQRDVAVGLARDVAAEGATGRVAVRVNAGDEIESGSVFLTVTGTSAEAGDDGEAGRGNRVNGLIAPGRPMTMESVAGKNPVSHVGKIYNVTAGLVAEALVREVDVVAEAECRLVSRIGHPVCEPWIVHVGVHARDGGAVEDARGAIEACVERGLAAIPRLAEDLVEGRVALDRWPLRV